MGADIVGARTLANQMGVNSRDFYDRDKIEKLLPDVDGFIKHNIETSNIPFYLDAAHAPTLTEIESRLRAWKYRHRIADNNAVAIVDFLQLADIEQKKGESEASALKRCAYTLARLAKKLQMAVLAPVQLNRGAERARPMIHHIEGSGAIAQAAESVMLVDLLRRRIPDLRKADDGLEPCYIDIVAQRSGESGKRLALYVDLSQSKFYDADIDDHKEDMGEWRL